MKAGMIKNEEFLENIFQNFNRSYLGFCTEYLKNINMVWRNGLSHHFKTIRLFLGAAVDEKTAAQKPKKVKILATPSQFFFHISPKLQKLGDYGFHQ